MIFDENKCKVITKNGEGIFRGKNLLLLNKMEQIQVADSRQRYRQRLHN
jgi:hypothetical protein